MNLRRYSFGTTSAIVTSMGLIVGFDVGAVPRSAVVSGLLIIALADNISDSLSIHIYQESENLEARGAFRATLGNFLARLVVTLVFVAITLLLPQALIAAVALTFGVLVLAGLTWVLSLARGVSVPKEMVKHLAVASFVVAASRLVGGWIAGHVQ